jgi:hypothetical protein
MRLAEALSERKRRERSQMLPIVHMRVWRCRTPTGCERSMERGGRWRDRYDACKTRVSGQRAAARDATAPEVRHAKAAGAGSGWAGGESHGASITVTNPGIGKQTAWGEAIPKGREDESSTRRREAYLTVAHRLASSVAVPAPRNTAFRRPVIQSRVGCQ